MSKSAEIRSALEAAKKHGFNPPAALEAEIANLENPQYRIAVVGKFQVGKSMLINKVFLQDNGILWEGDGRCTTSITTEVQYAPARRMEVYRWEGGAKTEEVLDRSVDDPTQEDFKAATVGEDRVALADRISRVKLFTPAEALKNEQNSYVILDTPGLDDPNPEILMNTTYRVIPSCDLAIIVAEPRQLDELELDLLRNKLIGDGITKFMVMLSYRPKSDKTAETRKEIIDTVKAQLANIGRKDVPVEMYCFDESVADIMSDVAEIRLAIRAFLAENAMPGREEKVANHLRAEIEKNLIEVAAKLKTAGVSEEEHAAFTRKIETEVEQFKANAELAFEQFQKQLKGLCEKTEGKVNRAVGDVFDKVYAELATKEDLGAMKVFLENMQTKLKSDLQDKISIIGVDIKSDIHGLIAGYQANAEGVNQALNLSLENDLNIKTGLVSKIPTLVYDAISVVVLNIILPGGWIVAIVAHLLGRTFMDPTKWIAKKIILSQVRSGLEKAKPEVSAQIMSQINAALEDVFAKTKEAIEAYNKSKVETIRSAMASKPAASGERAALESAKADLEAALGTL